MHDIIIVGAGGFGREVEWLINRINKNNEKWNVLGYADDKLEKGTKIGNSSIYCNTEELKNINKKVSIVIAIGNPKTRKLIYEKIKDNINLDFPNLIDPNAILGEIKLGKGNIICAGTIATVNIEVGNFTIINLDCTIGHDDIIENFVTIYPSVNVSGNVKINEYSEIGTGTQIIQGKNICSNVIIGAGAVVIKDIIEEGIYIGVPSRKRE